MAIYSVIDPINLKVVNTVVWDGLSDWNPPEGLVIQGNYIPINSEVVLNNGIYEAVIQEGQ